MRKQVKVSGGNAFRETTDAISEVVSNEPATERQLKYLRRLGAAPSELVNLTKSTASDLIEHYLGQTACSVEMDHDSTRPIDGSDHHSLERFALPQSHRNKRFSLYAQRRDHEILADIFLDRVPSPNLNDSASWRRVCQVFARNQSIVSDEQWSELCARRGRVHGTNPEDL